MTTGGLCPALSSFVSVLLVDESATVGGVVVGVVSLGGVSCPLVCLDAVFCLSESASSLTASFVLSDNEPLVGSGTRILETGDWNDNSE